MEETRRSFHHELDGVHNELVKLSARVVENIPRGTEALLSGDLEAAEKIILSDEEMNERSFDLEERCYRLLALQQPMATDLRALMATVRIISEVERSADLVVNICKASRRIYGLQLDARIRGLVSRISDQAQSEFRFATDAYAERDAPLAAAISDMDYLLDKTHDELIQSIFEAHKAGNCPLEVAVQMALVARFYERIGDHAVNIGERIRYMVTGDLERDHEGEQRRAEVATPAGEPGS
ncbi:MAG TPA: phosphate signaling complex protein PhoU, partial [Acidimicrobiales bacterium]